MKNFTILIKTGREVSIAAYDYRRDGNQYVFDRGNAQVTFVVADQVISVVEDDDDSVGFLGW